MAGARMKRLDSISKELRLARRKALEEKRIDQSGVESYARGYMGVYHSERKRKANGTSKQK